MTYFYDLLELLKYLISAIDDKVTKNHSKLQEFWTKIVNIVNFT